MHAQFQEATKRSGVAGKARDAVPRFVVQAALQNGQRWGRLSAGFAGGRALGQVWRGADDFQAAMCGAVGGGVCSATSIKGIPSSVATFVVFSYFVEKVTAGSKDTAQQQKGAARPANRQRSSRPAVDAAPTPGQRLDRLLGIAS